MKDKSNMVAVIPDSAPTVSYLTALASIKLLTEISVLDLTEDDYEFLVQGKLWMPVDRSRSRRCIEGAVFGALDMVGFPRFPPPVEFIAAAIAKFVHPVNVMAACIIMEGAQFSENLVTGVERPIRPQELYAFVLRILATDTFIVDIRERQIREDLQLKGVKADG